jgi:putative ATPase
VLNSELINEFSLQTTLARIIAEQCKESQKMRFAQLSATTAGVADVKEVVKVAKNEIRMLKRQTVLFIDEIHRFNKLQQVGNCCVILND